ncbi:hypothetical protein SAMN06265360_10628 [Haloechinothrix alba]|uniref:Uncharacterized protein n=1 Tax=Haloechinothrix alba TaxID=664784 RepID=A0A238WC75_9PSEU|nr:hypothetical protein [Haloechinothrix alba]SNR44175.1 hypothetical protein SAMN06265360_10628 [Haloechinothrix alba]
MYVYENKHTGQKVRRETAVRRFDRSDRWNLIEKPKGQPKAKPKGKSGEGNTGSSGEDNSEGKPDESAAEGAEPGAEA